MISRTHLGCATARSKGMCNSRLGIARERLEATVLAGLQQRLMEPDLFKEFCAAFLAEVNSSRNRSNAERGAAEAELAKIKRRVRQIVDAIADGVTARALKGELLALEAREDVLAAELAAAPERKVLFHPGMAEVYRERVLRLREALKGPGGDPDAVEAIRSLIDRIVLVPIDGKLAIDL